MINSYVIILGDMVKANANQANKISEFSTLVVQNGTSICFWSDVIVHAFHHNKPVSPLR